MILVGLLVPVGVATSATPGAEGAAAAGGCARSGGRNASAFLLFSLSLLAFRFPSFLTNLSPLAGD